jgi:prevent-host-death family protein
MNWHLQDARNNLSKVVRKAQTEGPQTVTIRGKRAAIVLSPDEYDQLAGKKKSLAEFLLEGPAWDDETVELVNQRSKDTGRKIDL